MYQRCVKLCLIDILCIILTIISPKENKITYKSLIRLLNGLGIDIMQTELYFYLRTHELMNAKMFDFDDVYNIVVNYNDRINLSKPVSPDILEPQNSLVPV